MKLAARNRVVEFPRRPMIMGIVNLVADSFSGDGIVDVDRALARAGEMIAEGAEIIDIGAESARTNRAAMSEQEEIDRLCPFIERFDASKALLSINTWRPAVARVALASGGHLLNDMSALPTDENARICAETGAALLIMHSVGEPKVPHTHVEHRDIMAALGDFFEEKIALACGAGLPRDAIILGPRHRFRQTARGQPAHLSRSVAVEKIERPILLPVSRKTVIGDVLGIKEPADRDAGTIACLVAGMLRGASIFRVHNVRAAAQAVAMIGALL